MALADLDGRDERRPDRPGRLRRARCSTSRDTAFVARFIGGHNVLPARAPGPRPRRVALRADRAACTRPGDDEVGLEAAVRLVEYQGTCVQLRLRGARRPRAPGPARRARRSTQAPVAAGERVRLSWPRAEARTRWQPDPPSRRTRRTRMTTSTTYRVHRPQRRPLAAATSCAAPRSRRRRRGRQQLPGTLRPRRRPDHAPLRRHRRERVQGAGRQVQGRYRHHHPVHDADLG